jgi:hypothetical protein
VTFEAGAGTTMHLLTAARNDDETPFPDHVVRVLQFTEHEPVLLDWRVAVDAPRQVEGIC